MTGSVRDHAPETLPNAALSRNVLDYARQVVAHAPYLTHVAKYLVWRVVSRTMLGSWWLVLLLISFAVAMSLAFSHVKEFQTPGLPYPLFVLSGLTLWIVVDMGVSRGMRSLQHARSLRRVLNVPSFLVSLTSLLMPVIHGVVLFLAVILAVVVYWMIGVHVPIAWRWELLLLPLNFILVLMLTTGLAAVVSVLYVASRDIRFVLPVLTKLWLLATPVLYPLSALPPGWREVSSVLNPLAPILEATRFALFGVDGLSMTAMVLSGAEVILIFLLGLWVSMRSEWVLPEMD